MKTKTKLNYNVLGKLQDWTDNAVAFAHECLGAKPSNQQIEALEMIPHIRRLTIRSGHGCGKDALAVWIALWFMTTRPYAKIPVTAPTNRQLQDIYWAELAKWFRKSRLQDEFIHQKDKFFHKSAPKDWWIRAISPQVKASKEEQAETLAGFHGDHLLIIGDEASGINDPVFIPLEGAMTQEDNKCLLIGNMTKNSGYFYDTHYSEKIAGEWNRLHWDSRESNLVEDSMVDFFRNKYGEDSSVFAVRVAGNPPHEDERTLIPLSWARQCLGNETEISEDEPLYLGVDVARYGEDRSIVLPRKGIKIFDWDSFQGINTISLGGHINLTYQELNADGLVIDEIGVGAGVTDWLMKHGHLNTIGLNVANKSTDIAKYDRMRDELWWRVRDNCMKGAYWFPDNDDGEELCNELAMPTYDFNVHGGVVVESKKQMKARGVASPNIADALCNTEYAAAFANRLWKKVKVKRNARRTRQSDYMGKNSWQTA